MKAGILWLLLGCLGVALPARAQTADEARTAAEALFVEGRRLMEQGELAQACAKFRESQSLDPGAGTLLNLARCLARSGRTASAWAAYLEAASLARASGQFSRENFAREQANRIAAELPRVRVEVAPAVQRAGLELLVDGESWSRGLWNLAAPIDRGRHRLEARAPNCAPWVTSFESTPGAVTHVVVPPLREHTRTELEPEPRRETAEESWGLPRTAAVVAAGVATVAVAVGTVFALDANATYARSEPLCPQNLCNERGLSVREEAFDDARLATVAFALGGAALTSATVLWFSATPAERPPRHRAQRRDRAISGFSLGVRGRW